MSKQSEAQAAQGYVAKPEPSTCINCAHFKSERVLPSWMVRDNVAGKKPWPGFGEKNPPDRYTVEVNGVEKNMRCGVGGFAVKKTATCNEFKRKDGAA